MKNRLPCIIRNCEHGVNNKLFLKQKYRCYGEYGQRERYNSLIYNSKNDRIYVYIYMQNYETHENVRFNCFQFGFFILIKFKIIVQI